jgi:adenylosuccinate lyase
MSYQSPFTQRYGSAEMRALWSEEAKRRAWRRVWVAVAEAQAAAGLVTPEQVDDIRANAPRIDVARSLAIEAEIGHDLMAELQAFAEQCPVGGGVLHWGLTSADVEDNADVVRQKASLGLILSRLREGLLAFSAQIDATADLPVLGYTHLQPAEPTTLGYRLATVAQDLLGHFQALARIRADLRGKGIKGAVGTAAPFVEMLQGTHLTSDMLENTVMEALGIQAFPVTSQTYSRIQDFTLLSRLAGLAATLHKFAFDLRLMQSPALDQAREPFGERQVGSSAMPFKRNPVRAEKICSLARWVGSAANTTWENAANSLLERTLDDSANRRIVIPEAFLACDEMLRTAAAIVVGLEVDRQAATASLEAFSPFAATERLLSALTRAGADRQATHARLREHCLAALDAMRGGAANPLPDRLSTDTSLLRYLQPARIRELLKADSYLGIAPERARALAAEIRERMKAPASEAGR